MLLGTFFRLFFDSEFIRFSAKSGRADKMMALYEQFRVLERKLEVTFKNTKWAIPYPSDINTAALLKTFMVQALKIVCQADRFATYGEERLVIFKLRLWHILESIMTMPYCIAWKEQLYELFRLL